MYHVVILRGFDILKFRDTMSATWMRCENTTIIVTLNVIKSITLPLDMSSQPKIRWQQIAEDVSPEVLNHSPGYLRRNGVDFLLDPFLQILKRSRTIFENIFL